MKSLNKFGVEFHKATLKNGSNVFLFKRKGMPIYLRAAFLAGSRFDTVPGTAHFLEHMLVAGTKRFPTKNLIADHIHKVGGEFSASTDPNTLRLNVEIPLKEDIQVGIDILTECLTASLFEERTMETERGAILSELKSKKSNPKEYIWDISHTLSMQGTPLAHGNLGSEEEIRSINLNILKEFYLRHINSGRATFIASGDIEIDELIDSLNKIDLPVTEKFKLGQPLPIIRDEDLNVEPYLGLTQLQVAIIERIVPNTYEELCSIKIINSILAGGRGSRLMTKLRYEKGLVYSVSGNVFYLGDWGAFRIGLSCDRDNLEMTKSIIFTEFEDLNKNNLTQEEFDNTKSKISKGSVRHMQTSNAWVSTHEIDAMYSPDSFKTIEDYIETVNKLSKEQVLEVINKYLNKELFYTAVCGDI